MGKCECGRLKGNPCGPLRPNTINVTMPSGWSTVTGAGMARARHANGQEGLGFEMPGKSEIMRAVQEGLNRLEIDDPKGNTEWTKAVKTKLCEIGKDRFGCKVYANGVDEPEPDGGEWLYDVTWLKHENDEVVDAPLIAECEWSDQGEIEDDFEKLLLARADVRLMIFDGNHKPGSKELAGRLAGKVREFNGSRAEDTWLLAAWEGSNDDWSFRYFTIEMNAAIPV